MRNITTMERAAAIAACPANTELVVDIPTADVMLGLWMNTDAGRHTCYLWRCVGVPDINQIFSVSTLLRDHMLAPDTLFISCPRADSMHYGALLVVECGTGDGYLAQIQVHDICDLPDLVRLLVGAAHMA